MSLHYHVKNSVHKLIYLVNTLSKKASCKPIHRPGS